MQGGGLKQYGFSYDYLDRITAADFYSPADTSDYSTRYYYNGLAGRQGNITNLTRKGYVKVNGQVHYQEIDTLSYSNYGNSNQIKRIVDQAQYTPYGEPGFIPGNSNDLTYDGNGNQITNPRLNFSYHYNYLNLPDTLQRTDRGSIYNLYDAAGTKLRKQVLLEPTTDTADLDNNPIPSGDYYGLDLQASGYVATDSIVGHNR